MVYDGDSTEPYIFTEYPDNPVESAGIEMLSPVGTYICEEAGFGGDFVIDLNLDRTFSYVHLYSISSNNRIYAERDLHSPIL